MKGSLVLSRLSVIISSSLAQNSRNSSTELEIFSWGMLTLWQKNFSGSYDNLNPGKPGTTYHAASNTSNPKSSNHHNSNASTCSVHPDPCAELQNLVSHGMVLIPIGIALFFFIVGALPTMFLRSRYRVWGVRNCLWVLIELWIHLLISYIWFTLKEDRAQAYVWALHSSSHILASWQPRKGVMPYPGIQTLSSLAGVVCVALFAWQFGPPVGLAAWHRRSDAQCGWAVHLTAVIGVGLVEWVLGPLECVVSGIGSN